MASSMMISNTVATNSDRALSRRKKKKKLLQSVNQASVNEAQRASSSPSSSTSQWRSEAQQHVYSSKLLKALRQVRVGSPLAASQPKRGRAVREAADRVLAVTAKGRTRWSRAILTNRLKLKFMKKNNVISKRQRVSGASRSLHPKRQRSVGVLKLKAKNLPAVQRKTRVLGRLVPGCRKQPLPVILEEATDYIAALEMQVKAMSALAELLSRGSIAGPPPPPPPPSS